MAKERQSSFELLRILAMVGVMVLHAGLYGLVADAYSLEERGLGIYFGHAFAVLSVNVFVIISGYFSIRLRLKGVLNFLWTISYWRMLTLILLCAIYRLVPDSVVSYLPFAQIVAGEHAFQGWFIGAYIGLMALSPMLNLYCDALATKRLGLYCFAFFSMEILFDWLLPSLKIFGGGYTPFAFVGLYMFGRYAARKDSRTLSLRISVPLFFATCLLAGLTMSVASRYGNAMPILRNKLMFASSGYTAPVTLLGSFLIIDIFKHLEFRSRLINWLAASAFAVYLFHGGLPFFKKTALDLFTRYDGVAYLLLVSIFIGFTYVAGTLLDQGRKWVWFKLSNALDKRIS